MFTIDGKYTTARIMIDDVEETCVSQIHHFVNHLAFTNPVSIMPDTHAGKGSVIGFTMEMTNKIIPNVVGVDIGCVDAETEFLSPEGWIKISDYNGQDVMQYNRDTGEGTFIQPIAYIKAPCKEFYHIKTKYGVDQVLSEDHKVLCKIPYGRKRQWITIDITAKDLVKIHEQQVLGFKGRFITTFTPRINSSIVYSDEDIRVQVMAAADGHYPNKSNNRCNLHLKKNRKIKRAIELLDKAKRPYRLTKNKSGTTTISFFAPSKERILSWYYASYNQLKIIVDECLKWDGNEKDTVFFTRKKESADFINYAMTAVGLRSILKVDKRTDGIDYRVFGNKNIEVGVAGVPKTPIKKIKPKDGMKYCFRVPRGYWIMRRNGRIAVTGNCGMLSIRLSSLGISLEELDHKIRNAIPFGAEMHDNTIIHMKNDFPWHEVNVQSEKFAMAYLNKFGVRTGLPRYDIEWFLEKCKQIGGNLRRIINSIGTLGSGNHFIETGLTENGDYWITIHSGSRNFGKRICDLWQNRAVKTLREDKKEILQEKIKQIKEKYKETPRTIKEKIKEAKGDLGLACGINMKGCEWLEGEDATGYLFDMIFAQMYAKVNREYMARIIEKIVGSERTDQIETVHNFIDFQDFIIRKGAVRSYEGERLIIPFNMRDGILICEGKSNPEWNYSAPHGAGRIMSRSQANRELDVEEFKGQMEGVYSTSVGRTTLDEAPGAYKDSKMIEEAIEPTAVILSKIKPVHNMKDGGKSFRKKKNRKETEMNL